jgi:signal transduction histidine kinase
VKTTWRAPVPLRRPRTGLLVAAVPFTVALMAPAAEPPLLTTAAAVAAATAPANMPPPRVLLKAVVSYQDAQGTTFVVDETGVTDFYGGVKPPPLVPGDRVRVEGVVQNGGFMGAIRPRRLERLGSGPPPEPMEVSPAELSSGLHVFRRGAVTGVVRAVEPDGETTSRLRLAAGNARITIFLEEEAATAVPLVGTQVRGVGLVAGEVNDRRQVVTPWLRVRSLADIEVLDPGGDPFLGPALAWEDLPAARATGRRVLLSGTVAAGPLGGGLFLRNGARRLFVETAAADVTPGDIVEAAGFVDLGTSSLFLADAVCRIVGHGSPPVPTVTGAATISACDGDLVTLDGRLVQQIVRGDRQELLLDVGGFMVTALIEGTALDAIPVDSQVRVTGPIRGTSVRERNRYLSAMSAADLWLARPADLVVLQQPPWWTPRRIALAAAVTAAGLAATGAIAAGWITLLRRQVTRQLAVIEGGLRAEAVAEERRRIAGEFHDSLEQGLAALSLRLGMAAGRLPAGDARGVLEHQRQLLGWLQTETREFLWDLRDPIRPESDLGETLAAQVDNLRSLTAVPLDLALPPALPPLPATTQHQVVRIVREAVHNAIRHAEANRIDVRVESPAMSPAGDEGPRLVVEIRDDGRGFDAEGARATRGHYGLKGMEERAARIGGTLEIDSRPDGSRDGSPPWGTVVRLRLPVPAMVGPAAGRDSASDQRRLSVRTGTSA